MKNHLNINCPHCMFRKEDDRCGFYGVKISEVQSPNTCEMFTCTNKESLRRAKKFALLVIMILGFIALVIMELKLQP